MHLTRNRISSSVSAPIAESRLLLAAVPLQPNFAFKAAATEPKQAHTFFWTDKAQMKQQVDNTPGSYVRLGYNFKEGTNSQNTEAGYSALLNEMVTYAKSKRKKAVVSDWGAKGEETTGNLSNIVDRWIRNKAVFDRNTDVILNIANEWGGKQGAQTNWRDAYITYGKKLREAGIANEIMIDTGGWGQDPTNVKLYGKQVADEIDKAARAKAAQLRTEADRMTNPTQKQAALEHANKLASSKVSYWVHMYQYWRDSRHRYDPARNDHGKWDIKTEIQNMKSSSGRDIYVGEYAWTPREAHVNPNPGYQYAQLIADAKAGGAKATIFYAEQRPR